MLNADSVEHGAHDRWAERGEYWLKKLNPVPQYKARKRRFIHKPLVLSGHGIRLRVDRGTLHITCGFTHYPQKREEYRFFAGDRQMPSRIVVLDGDGSITFDALQWLSEQGVALMQLDWRGNISSVGGAHYAANPDLVRHQWAIQNTQEATEFTHWLIHNKIENGIQTIKHIAPSSQLVKEILQKMAVQAELLKCNPPKTTLELLTLEGLAAMAYFRYWYTLPIKWRGLNRKPIPPEWYQVGTRTGKHHSQFAIHPVNAILNYAYGILESQVRTHLSLKGVDPTIGFIHVSNKDRDALVLDLMEPVRPIMDKKVLEFVMGRTFSPDDFIVNKNGVCRLHPQFARVLVKAVQDIDEVETITAANIKRLFTTKLNAQKQLATNKSAPLNLI
ncbi:MAG: CRISPR-associated endonuclease Cas1 [Rickettsiales bacterium]